MTEKYNQDSSINENWLAEEITSREAGLKEVDIAQIKESLKATLDILATEFSRDEVTKLLDKHS